MVIPETAFIIININAESRIFELELCSLNMSIYGSTLTLQDRDGTPYVYRFEDIGKIVFFSKEDAERKLSNE